MKRAMKGKNCFKLHFLFPFVEITIGCVVVAAYSFSGFREVSGYPRKAHEPGVKVASVNNWTVRVDHNAVSKRLTFKAPIVCCPFAADDVDKKPWKRVSSVASNTDNLCKLIGEGDENLVTLVPEVRQRKISSTWRFFCCPTKQDDELIISCPAPPLQFACAFSWKRD